MSIVEKNDAIQIERLELGPFGTNAYILICAKTRESVLVDAPGEINRILKGLKHTRLRYILMSHNHMDHTGALSQLVESQKVPVAAHASDAPDLPVPVDILMQDGDVISFGAIRLDVMHTPGHTPGSLCFRIDDILISGDTLFPGGPGKTMSPSDFKQILESLKQKIFLLPNSTRVYPGHGEAAILGKEKALYQLFTARSHDPDLCGDILWDSS